MKTVTVASTAIASLVALVLSSYVDFTGNGAVFVGAVASLMVAIFAFSWPKISGIPSELIMGFVTLVAGCGAIIASLNAPPREAMLYYVVFVVLGLALTFLVQLLRGTGASQRLYSVCAGAAASLIAASTSGWVAVDRLTPDDVNSPLTLLVAMGITAAILVGCIRWPDRIVAPLAIVISALVSGMAAIIFTTVTPWQAMFFAGIAAAITASCRAVLVAEGGPKSRLAAVAYGLTPIMLSGALVYFAERLVFG